MRKHSIKRGLSLLMCFAMICGMMTFGSFATEAAADEAVSNPKAVIDIVVNVPADYPGTFLDFKDELTANLIAKGMDPTLFRIISSAVKIDTTETSGWYIYDHYLSQDQYNRLNLNSAKQPFRQADNNYTDGPSVTTIEEQFATSLPTTCKNFVRHIAPSVNAAGKASMTFAGYGSQPMADFMIYPAASDSRRTFSFDIDAKVIDTHTLDGAGFFINAGIQGSGSSATLNGYLLYYKFSSATSGNVYLIPVNGVNAYSFQTSSFSTGNNIASDSFALTSTKKARIDVDLQADKVTVQQRYYQDDGSFSETKTLFGGQAVALNRTGYNGFGPMVGYSSHGCSSLSSFGFSDLEMSYEASAFDALKNLQYSEDAKYKYFINLAGTSGDPGIPNNNELYLEGIKRLTKNEIFYISNVDDGKILTEPTENSSGVGPDNGLYATESNYIDQIARYIAENYKNQVKYNPPTIQQKKDKPVADFTIVDNTDETKQVLTMHLQHLKETNGKVTVKIKDKSIPADTGAKIDGWALKIYDPDNTVVADSGGYKSSPDQLPTYEFTKNSRQGRYTFELVVKDNAGYASSIFQTYLIAYVDNKPANITASSTGIASKAQVSLVDTGWGISDDGVILIENQGSGVLKYQIDGGEIVTLPKEVHSHSVEVPLTEADLTVTAWDECGNQSTQTFKTSHVTFKDKVADDYYILSGGSLGQLPEGPQKENELFQGWAKADGTIVSTNTAITEKEIELHPVYTTEEITLTFNANGGKFGEGQTTVQIKVPKGSMVIDHLLSGDKLPAYDGYTFNGWETIDHQQISTQKADGDMTLNATWKKASFKLIFDANKGTLGKLKVKNVQFGDNILNATKLDEANNPYQGTSLPTREGFKFTGWAATPEGTAIDPSATMPAEDYTVYAQWAKDDTKYIVSFDSQGGSPVNSKSYPTSQSNYGSLNTPSRSGYTFDGWYDEAGTLRESNGAVYQQADHTLTAHWTAKDDTQYKIEYYTKTDLGYSRVDSETVIKRGTTDTECSVTPEDIKQISGYWYNENSDNNVLSGTITGDGKMTLKLSYDRYFNINTSSKGNGSISESATVNEGSSHTVTWQPQEGYVVHRVMVDGVIRDELLAQNSFTWNDIHGNHQIYVEFVPNGSTGGTDPVIGENKYYQIKTTVKGVYGSCDITPTQSVPKGSDHAVDWKVKDNYYVASVTVDGVEYSVDTTHVDFTAVEANHEVIVEVKPIVYPSIGGNATDGYYTVTVNRYGGNATDTPVSDSCVVKPGDSKTVTWSASNGYHVVRVTVDGVELDADAIKAGAFQFDNISANHVVDVYIATDGDNIGNWDNMINVSTQLIGAPGTITAGATLAVGSDYTVTWNPVLQTGTDPSDPNYSIYQIDRVEVNGEAVTVDGNSLQFTQLDQNKDVKVYVKPIVFSVNVSKYGNGTVSQSKTLFQGQNYVGILGTPAEGHQVVKLIVDGVEQVNSDMALFGGPVTENVQIEQATLDGVKINISSISKDHEIIVYFSAIDNENIPTEDEVVNVTAKIIGGTGIINGTGVFAKGESTNVTWTLESGYVVTDVKVNGQSQGPIEGGISLGDLQNNTNVEIFVAKKTDGDGVIPQDGGNGGQTGQQFTVSTEIIGGPGTITNSAIVNQGSNHTVDWKISENGYVIRDVIVDGVSRPDLITQNGIGSVTFEQIAEDHKVVIIVGKSSSVDVDVDGDKIPDVNIDTDGDGKPDINIDLDGDGKPEINIDTDNTGKWKPSSQGGNNDGIWKPDTNLDTNGDGTVDVEHGFRPNYDNNGDGIDDNWKPNKDVYPDGLANPGYDTSNPNVNIDKDGDGNPDINIDTNGDGKPDINVDTNGDGNPNINIDKDGNGTPDINIDTNGDGNPDVNIDKDGDGNPDINIDKDGDGNPDINIDTNGDGKPDVNIDTNGDKEPDINIDTNGDKEPDINIDTDGDKKPDTNIDTNGDGKPDINIDTNGDGKPDVNIDTNGNGKPDINIDKDGDGTPDINIDKDGDGKPDINIDTNKDGEPDINIDTNGDGKPDINIDTNGNGKPDINIDTDGDGKPDKNIDADGDGVVDSKPTGVKTGDPMFTWVIILCVSFCGTITLLVMLKKRTEK